MAKKANAHKQISKMMDEHNPYRDQQQVAKGLTRKWKKTGLLDGIDNEYERSGMAVLLENQARQLIDEASKTGTSANSEEWSGVALPLVRKVFGEIAAKDFVSVALFHCLPIRPPAYVEPDTVHPELEFWIVEASLSPTSPPTSPFVPVTVPEVYANEIVEERLFPTRPPVFSSPVILQSNNMRSSISQSLIKPKSPTYF